VEQVFAMAAHEILSLFVYCVCVYGVMCVCTAAQSRGWKVDSTTQMITPCLPGEFWGA